VRGIASTLIVVAIAAYWFVALRPQILGGPTSIVLVSGTSMEPKLHTGDLVLVHRRDSYRVGDVVAYRVPKGSVGAGSVVIHRITGGSAETGFVLRGDNRTTDDQWRPRPADVMGRQWVALPTSHRLLTVMWSPVGFAALAAAFAFALIAFGSGKPPEDRSGQRKPSPPPSRS
jgi:signal peptidase